MEQRCICVCYMSDAVLKLRPQSIQEASLHYLHNWVSSVQLLSIQWLRNWVSSLKHFQHHGMRGERGEGETQRERGEKIQKSKWVYLHPSLHTLQWAHIYLLYMWHSRKFWQPCQNLEVLHPSRTGVQSLSHSIITKGLYSPSLLYMQSSDYWTGYKLCYFLHLTKNCSFVERWFEQPKIT